MGESDEYVVWVGECGGKVTSASYGSRECGGSDKCPCVLQRSRECGEVENIVCYRDRGSVGQGDEDRCVL